MPWRKGHDLGKEKLAGIHHNLPGKFGRLPNQGFKLQGGNTDKIAVSLEGWGLQRGRGEICRTVVGKYGSLPRQHAAPDCHHVDQRQQYGRTADILGAFGERMMFQ